MSQVNLEIALGGTLFLGAFYSWTSRINDMFFFGRTVDPELPASDAGRAITRGYLRSMILATLGSALVAWGGAQVRASLAAAGLLFEGLAFYLVFAHANRQVRALTARHELPAAQTRAVGVDLLQPPSYWVPGLFAVALPVAVGACALVAGLLLTHPGAGFGARGSLLLDSLHVHRLDGLFSMSVGLLTGSAGLLLIFRSSARLRTRLAQWTVHSSMTMAWIGAALMPVVLFCNAQGIELSQGESRAIVAAVVLALLSTAFWNQARARRFAPSPVELGADDRWRWGLFYVDRADPALFVQNRWSRGYSLNYGKLIAWPITLGFWGYLIFMLLVRPIHP